MFAHMKQFLRIAVVVSTLIGFLLAQELRASTSALGTTISLSQIQDELSNRMVFTGPELVVSYRSDSLSRERYDAYRAELGAGMLYNREVLCISARITPVDLTYAWHVWTSDAIDLYVGGRGLWTSNIQVYPDLHMGQDFWLTEFSLSPHVLLTHNSGLRVSAGMSLLSAVSRPPERRDPYEFSLDLWDILSDTYSNMRLALPNSYVHVSFCGEYPVSTSISLAYTFDYRSYAAAPSFNALSHSITMLINL
jgi:hypothetical protein